MVNAILTIFNVILTLTLIGLGKLAIGVILIFKDANLLGKALLVLNPLSLTALSIVALRH